jgi:uncharacterized repeat protein (TIGR01451 family)
LALAFGGKIASAWMPPSSCDFLTGGGFIFPSGPYTGNKANFGVAGGCKHGSGLGNPPAPYFGHLEYQDKAANLKVHWKTITGYMVDTVFFPDPKARLICGTASTNRGDVTFIVRAKDTDHVRNGDDDNWDDWNDDKDGRNSDEFDIQLRGAVSYSTFPSGPHQLGNGNIRLHKPNNSSTGIFGGSCPGLPAPDVSVSKTTSTPTVAVGDQAIYNITVTAGGTGNSANVTLNDWLPAGHTWVLNGSDAASCTITGTNLYCTFGTMASGTTRSISVSTTTVAGDCTNGLDNTATVTATTDANPNNNSSGPIHITVNCPPPQGPDVSIVKSTDTPFINSASQVRYQLVVHNAGPGTANVTVHDDLPTGNSGLVWTINPAVPGCSIPDGHTLDCLGFSFASLASGTDITIHVEATPAQADCPNALSNFATVSSANDPQPANNTSDTVIILACQG